MDIRFTLQPQYSPSQYVAGPFNLSGTSSGGITYLLASNVTKEELLAGYVVTTPYQIVSGVIGSEGICLDSQSYSLVFSPGPIVVGNFTTYSGISKNGIVKMNNSGATDTTFNVGVGFTTPTSIGQNKGPMAISRQNDGKIVVVGVFNEYNEVNYYNLIRLNPDGSKDYSFSAVPSLFSATTVIAVATLPDGKILVGGCQGLNPTGSTQGMLYRLNNDGSIDNTFLANGVLGGTNINGTIKVITPITDGNILVAGGFNNPQLGIMKLSSLGTRDATFLGTITGTLSGNLGLVECMVVDSQNRIMIGGSFTGYAGSTTGTPIRISTTGGIDGAWLPNCVNSVGVDPLTPEVTSIVQDNSGNVYIAGYYSSILGVVRNGYAKLTPLGALVSQTTSGFAFATTPTNNQIWFPGPKLGILSDGNILATGPFLLYNSGTAVFTNGFAKINSSTAVLIPSDFTTSGQLYTVANYCGLVCV
jgi:uncharacterized delta-60 repeat protein